MADAIDIQKPWLSLTITHFQKRTILFVIPPLVLSFLVSVTLLISQCVIINLLDSHIRGSYVTYGRRSTLISLDTAPNSVLIATSVIGGALTVATAIGLWGLRHPTKTSNERPRTWRGVTILVGLANIILTLICAVIVSVTYAPPFKVRDYELRGYLVRGTRETWLCSLQDEDGSGVGDVQRWGSIGCRMSAASRWMSVAMLVLASMAFGIVVGIVLGIDKREDGYEPVSAHDEEDDEQ